MTRLARLACSAAALALGVSLAARTDAQGPPLQIDVVQISDGAYPEALAVFNLEDASSAAMPVLSTTDLSVTMDGSPAEVTAVDLANSEDAPLDVQFMFDTSGSMAGAPLSNAKAAAKAFIADLSPADRVAVASFGDEVTLVQDYTTDRVLADGAIDGLVAQGNTALYQATTVASLKAASSLARRRAVILLSDGADFGGRSIATREESIAAATNAGVPIFTIAQGNDLDRAYLQEIAGASKGRYLEAPAPEDLQSLYAGIGRLLRSQYVVRFDASAAAFRPESSISITVRSGERSATSSGVYRPLPGFVPPINVTGVQADEEIGSARNLGIEIPENAPIDSVHWYVDDVSVFETVTPPYAFNYDPALFAPGTHALRAEAAIGASTINTPAISFTSTPPPLASGGGPPVMPIAVAAAGLIGVVAACYMFLRNRAQRAGPRGIPVDQRTTPWVSQIAQARQALELPADVPTDLLPVEQIGDPKGVLISRAGPDLGAEYVVGGRPVSIGSGSACAVRIDDPELASEEARIWVRSGHLMLHKMTRLSVIAADGTPGGWSILEEGDRFDVGEHTFEFKLLAEEQPPAPDVADVFRSDVPRPLDAAQPRLGELMPKNDGGFALSADD